MKRIFCLLFLIPALIWAQTLDKFHVVTVANHLEAPGCFFLLDSAKIHGIDLKIAGLGEPYLGNGTKMVRLLELFEKEQWPDDDIVIFTDAFDTMFTTGAQDMLDRFLSFDVPLLISAEKGYVEGVDPVGETTFVYPNLGGYVGYVGELKKFIKRVGFKCSDRSDQQVFYPEYMQNQSAYKIDTECKIFAPFLYVELDEVEFFEDGKIRLVETDQMPAILHGDDGAFKLLIPSFKRTVANTE